MDANISRGYVQLDRPSDVERLVEKTIDHLNRPPNDRCHCIYLALLLAGVGFLLPYNSFIIAVDYFQSRYPATTIVFDMSLIYILVALVAVIINNLLVETLSLKTRITFGYVVAFFTLLFVAVFEIWFEIFDLRLGYYVNLLAVAVVSFGCTVQQSSFYGYTSMLPARYTQAVMTGEIFRLNVTKIESICLILPETKCGGKYGVLSLRTPPSSPVVQSEAEVDNSVHEGSEDNWADLLIQCILLLCLVVEPGIESAGCCCMHEGNNLFKTYPMVERN
ncbi:equilibrative nucleoside transporter 4 [Caerostris extrusa]|uniref:Equilibrative nucleoside transporter 4 n=1 Tax=Caerostris extrusa TaxID=172846 RepID=A0AAV4UH56_CAEEX|nr:equilibrative nucleoside transporter 4 [Caerostris extrusa]